MQPEEQWHYSADRILERWKSNETADGSTPTDPWRVERWLYNASGVLEARDEDLQRTASGVETRREQYAYDARGLVVETRRVGSTAQGASVYASLRRVYDARGSLLQSIEDPGYSNSTDDGDEIVQWARYGLGGELVEVFAPLSTAPFTVESDRRGRRVASQSGFVDLGLAHEGTPSALATTATSRFGRTRQEWEYDELDQVVARRAKTQEQGSQVWLVASEERREYDAAGRSVVVRRALDWNPNPRSQPLVLAEWATEVTDYYPAGQTWREYAPGVVEPTTVSLDDYGRTVSIQDPAGNRAEQSFGSNGRLLHQDTLPFDERTSSYSATYRTAYDFDPLERVTAVRYHGRVGSGVEVVGTRFAYDGQDRVAREWACNFTTGATGQVVLRNYSQGGLLLSESVGKNFATYAGHQKTVRSYDRFGRVISDTLNPGAAEG